MKILQVVHTFPPYSYGGAEKYAYQLSKSLAKQGHEVHVFFPVEGRPNADILDESYDGLILHKLFIDSSIFSARQWKRGLFFKTTYQNPIIENRFFRLLSREKPDVVHIQHLMNLSVGLIDVARSLGIPIVVTLHDYWYICPTITLVRHNGSICEKPNPNVCRQCWSWERSKVFRNRWGKIVGKIFQYFIETVTKPSKFEQRNRRLLNSLNSVDKIIAPSEFLRALYIRFGMNSDKIVTVYHGYDDSWFSWENTENSDREFPRDRIIFGFLGRIVPTKGIHVLMEAFMKIPEEKAILFVYGPYNPKSEYFQSLKELVKNKHNIRIMGQKVDVHMAYSSVDVVVIPSVCFETFSLILAESKLHKKPVIASDLGAIPEFLEDEVEGFLFRPGDVNDLYEKMMRFVQNPGLIAEMSKNIQPHVKPMKEHAREIEGIYIKLLQR